MYSKYKPYIIFGLITFGIGILGGAVTYLGMSGYESTVKPPLTPPSILFPIVWSILFLLMTISAGMIFKSNDMKRQSALLIYYIQLIFNFGWCVFFFGFQLYFFSFIWLVVLWLLVLAMIVYFYRIKKIAGIIQIPYLLWLTFAAYLNIMIWILNI